MSNRRQRAEKRGRTSEWLAALLLRLKGYRILPTHVRTRAGEIDLVARSTRGVLCIIGVKARKAMRSAVESVSLVQQARIMRAASLFVAARPKLAHTSMRFDIVTVAPLPRHIRDAWRPQ
jgi:putative endonuclease